MEVLIISLLLANVMLGIGLVVASMARMDQRYAAKVRAEHDRKAILRGEDSDRH
ncbi:MAG: hypothetical protein OXC60_10865 [Litoreibacter sp.]|nr:hypothetical protein [Litoreibacter sp.]MCY4335156.1 hypothetical protein [Litoreibacter sp.]